MTVADLLALDLDARRHRPVRPALVRPRGLLACAGAILGSLPTLYILHSRKKRMEKLENQLPDAIDLMGRAMRAGHAFPTALNMVGDEMAEPIGAEFRTLFDEINYGVKLEDALLNLLSRVPSADLQYFVVGC